MHPAGLSRRGFLARSIGALGMAGFPHWYAHELLALQQEKAADVKRFGPNDRVQFGVIGSGDRSKQLIGDLSRHPGWQIIALCDVDKSHREEVSGRLKKHYDEKKIPQVDIALYNDFRELVARKDIDAVLIVTPDHWHTIPAVAAAKAGKDIYLEKPMTLTIAEGRPLIKAVRNNKRILQVGSQQRSDARFRLAIELVRNGRIGKLQTIETRIGGAPRGGPFKQENPPEGLDWDFWLGQTPKVPYIKQRCHYEFRWWYEYSGGKGTDWGAHHNDIAQWGLDMDNSGPISVESKGEAPVKPGDSQYPLHYNCHTQFEITFKYASGVTLLCKSGWENSMLYKDKGEDNGVIFVGDKGSIFVNRGKIIASDKKIIDEPLPQDAVRVYHSSNHMGNFLEGVRNRKDPICNVDIGHHSVTVCHLGNISLRLGGKKLQWNPEAEQFTGDGAAEGNKMVKREMRAPWRLEV